MNGPSRGRQPIFNLPGVVTASCLVLVALYALYAIASLEMKSWAIADFAFVPARMAIALDVARPALRATVQQVPQDTFALLIGQGGGRWWTLVTYALLHGSLAHVGLNCLWLVVFGTPVARRFGPVRFLGLALAAVIAGALCVFLWDPASFMPVIGASAAVSGAAGAAARFIFPPSADAAVVARRLRTRGASRLPALTLGETFTSRAGLAFIALFLGAQVLTGLIPEAGGAPIAWQGHIGGFLAGLVLFPLFDPPRPLQAAHAEDPPTEDEAQGGQGEPTE